MSPSINPFELDAGDPAHPLADAYECLLTHGLDGAGEALRILVNQASRIEREQFLGAAAYERAQSRTDQANGFKNKTVLTRFGKQQFSVP